MPKAWESGLDGSPTQLYRSIQVTPQISKLGFTQILHKTGPRTYQQILAFRLPEGLADGPYVAYVDDASKQAFKPSASSSPVEVCDNSWVTSCGCGYTLDHDNADRAMVGISEQCGDVVAFICFGGPTGRSHISSAAQQITTVCGLGIAGSAALGQGLFYEPTIGYMCYEPCLDFCVNSKVSFASHC
ncbi:hypothetical protein B0T24DRAFT_672620 [Lasiosphaeria ovina]|uniref:Uncharacterized protein n=1 Tax=Lasiosphaeria ovina TaxID=92902 RepID=A0AAE0NJP1_9PEZI|nr:hypothetical protein B0T24DRAFT_672620 [Lasiosphaeria ovina]